MRKTQPDTPSATARETNAPIAECEAQNAKCTRTHRTSRPSAVGSPQSATASPTPTGEVRYIWVLILVLTLATAAGAAIATFEDLTLPLESYWNGSDGSGRFSSGGVYFENNYNADWQSWDGFSYSNITDTVTAGTEGQYNAITGVGQGRSNTYGVAYVGWEEPPTATLSTAQTLQGLYVTNNNFAYYSMRDGSLFAKKFGGQTGDDPDWLKLTITGKDTAGDVTGTADFFLADFRPADNDQDYIVDSWQFIDLTTLGQVKALQFVLASSDTGTFGMNTPGYFCIDTVVPEPATALLLTVGAVLALRRRR